MAQQANHQGEDRVEGTLRYEDLPIFDAFERVGDPSIYTPLPNSWLVGVTDVVGSTKALAEGRYKEVNLAGAAAVAAVKNALGGLAFPFVFGGDGTIFAVPPEAEAATRQALVATANHVRDELGLTLRTGMLRVAAIRAAGHDLQVARYAASHEAIYAMFSGGGAKYAEGELKSDRIAVVATDRNVRPDLAGLSCRFAPFESRRGVILSVVVVPAADAPSASYWQVARDVIAVVQAEERQGHPLPVEGPPFRFPVPSVRYEAAAAPGNFTLNWLKINLQLLIGAFLNSTGQKLGELDMRRYRNWVTRNSDFRKFDDGLKMTIDCSPKTVERLTELLEEAEAKRIVDYGLFRQESALITCIVPSVMQDDHLHFLDGAGGGYTLAARELKARLAARSGDASAEARAS